MVPDTGMVVLVDAGPHVCLAEPDQGAVTLGPQTVISRLGTPADPGRVRMYANANGDAMPDIFQLELYKGYTHFAGSIQPGTFTIMGDDLQYSTCGLCARIFTDFDQATGTPSEQQYLATGGTVTITSITPNLTGSISDVTFVETSIDPTTYVSEPVASGCATMIVSASFDAVNEHTP